VAACREALTQTPALLETMGISGRHADRADLHCGSAIRDVEMAAERFDKRLQVRTERRVASTEQ
jgi:hypothetical protein